MSDQETNPFKIITVGNAKVQAGLTASDVGRFSGAQVSTWICAVASANQLVEAGVMVLDGVLWPPEDGTVLELEAPSREAVVVGQKYEVDPAGELTSYVYVLDPATIEQPRVEDAGEPVN